MAFGFRCGLYFLTLPVRSFLLGNTKSTFTGDQVQGLEKIACVKLCRLNVGVSQVFFDSLNEIGIFGEVAAVGINERLVVYDALGDQSEPRFADDDVAGSNDICKSNCVTAYGMNA